MISFEAKNVKMPEIDFDSIEIWLNRVADMHGKRIGNINYLFCDDDEILNVNKKFLQHDYYTDIITFDYSYRDKVSGDIFISLDTVKSNSDDLKVSFYKELYRVIVHGLLHICGIDDKGPGEREIMEKNEDSALEILNI